MNADAICPVATNAKVELATLYVQEHFIGKGIGSALISHAERWAMQRTDAALWLTVNARNARAIAFYAKHRYTTLGSTAFRLGHEDHENFVLAGLEERR
jgi:GNAT superfamily N-acetyltransferase